MSSLLAHDARILDLERFGESDQIGSDSCSFEVLEFHFLHGPCPLGALLVCEGIGGGGALSAAARKESVANRGRENAF